MSEQPSSNQMCQKYDWLKCPDDPEKQCSECPKKIEQRTSNSAVYEVQEGMDRDLNKQFRVTDTRTDSRVATCYVQSNADLVCAALNAYTADEPAALTAILEATADAEFDCSASYFRDAARKAHRIARAAIEEGRAAQPPAVLPQYELFVQARDLLCKIAGETDASRMEVNAWEAMELSRKMRAAAMIDLSPWLKRRTDGTAEPPSVTPSNPMVEASLPHITAALLSLSNARCVALGQTKSAVRENDAQCNGNCFLVGGPFVAEDPSCPKHGNH